MNYLLYINILYLINKITSGTKIDSATNIANHPNWKLLNDEICGISLSDRIIGGIDANLGQYPWIASIGYILGSRKQEPPLFQCGGALINNRYILSAAHCVTSFGDDRVVSTIRLGEHNTETEIDCDEIGLCADPVQDFKPEKIIWHENWRDFKNDISLVRLDRKVEFTRWISPICLPQGDLLTESNMGHKTEIIGWGIYQMQPPAYNAILQTVTLPIIDIAKCRRAFPLMNLNSTMQICSGGITGKDSCNGDSGGPMMKVSLLNGSPKYVLIGCVSFGAQICASPDAPAVYTRIAYYMPWILNQIKE